MLVDFLQPCLFGVLDHNWLPALFSLRFDLSVHNLRTAVFCLSCNFVANWQGGFIALVCLIDTDVPDDIGFFLEKPLDVDTLEASIVALYCCWSSHFTADCYNFSYFLDICVNTKNCYSFFFQHQLWPFAIPDIHIEKTL